MDDISTWEAGAQAAAIAAGEVSAEDVMQATLARIGQVNPGVNAVVSLRDEGVLLAEAKAAENRPPEGPLHGLPIAIKDLADARGLPTSQGSPAFAGQMAARDSLHVARLRAAGAIVVGKTNTPEFGLGSHTYNPVYGVTCNPYDRARSCGGSSGGAAVALATGMLSIADGSDMMGSLRNPAGWCNVYGMRPTWGVVPGTPEGESFLHPISTNGPMARSPADLALMLGVMGGREVLQPYGRDLPDLTLEGGAKGARIAWLGDWGGDFPYEEGIAPLCEAALAVLAEQGADPAQLGHGGAARAASGCAGDARPPQARGGLGDRTGAGAERPAGASRQ
jgi:amidase